MSLLMSSEVLLASEHSCLMVQGEERGEPVVHTGATVEIRTMMGKRSQRIKERALQTLMKHCS